LAPRLAESHGVVYQPALERMLGRQLEKLVDVVVHADYP
jgi:hypothetical protein